MTEPITFRVLQNMQTALRGIKVANGYHHDLAVLAVKLDPSANVENLIGDQKLRPFAILQILPDTYEHFPAEQVRIVMPFVVHFVAESDLESDDSRAKVFYRACSDIEKALAADSTRGDLVTDTRIQSREMQEWEGLEVWAMVTGEIRENRTFGAAT